MQHSSWDWRYHTEPNGKACMAMKGEGCFWPRGKMVGGTNGMNAMIYARGTRFDFDDWAARGNPTWGYDDVMKYFRKAENLRSKRNNYKPGDHGHMGPMGINNFLSDNKFRSTILKGMKELGYNEAADFNEDTFIGYMDILGTTDKGRRITTAMSHLVKGRPNLHVIKNAHVRKINLSSDNKATGVTFVYNKGKEYTVNIHKEVIVSAGAIGSAQLLMLSGIGPANHLKHYKIPVSINLPVGQNLKDHASLPVVFKLDKSTAKEQNPEELINGMYNLLMGRYSFLHHHEATALTGFINTTSLKGPNPDIQTTHFFSYKNSPELKNYVEATGFNDHTAKSILAANENTNTFIIYLLHLKPKSLGHIHLSSANYMDSPKIYPNYMSSDEDVKTYIRALNIYTRLEKTKAFQKREAELHKIDLPRCNNIKYKTDEYWRCYMSYLTTTVYHPVGTAKMGTKDDETSVVDYRLRVHGAKGLRVADASVMPDIVAANTNAAIIMIGEKVSDMIKEDWDFERKDKNHHEL